MRFAKSTVYFLLIFILFPPFVSAADPFSIDLSYEGSYLIVELERLSKDESKHFMQQLTIQKNDSEALKENLVNQNHLNKIKKMISLSAIEGDQLQVTLNYGQNDTFTKSITIGGELPEEEQSQSVLINKNIKEFIGENRSNANTGSSIKLKRQQYGYEDLGKQNYGQKGFGYEPEKRTYGRSLKKMDEHYTDVYGHNPYGYKSSNEEFGYKEEHEKYGQKGFGYDEKEEYVEQESYGRKLE